MEKNFAMLADDARIEKTAQALKKNGINVVIFDTGIEASKRIREMVPSGAEIMTMTSVTLDETGVAREINETGNFNSVRLKFNELNKEKDRSEMQKLGAAPEWAIGSVHAITENGNVVIASATGSQLPAYAYGSSNVVWVVGAQKIVKDMDEAMERIHDYVYPLENERALKAYGMGSGVNKVLIINKEVDPKRITIFIVKEKLGF